MKILFILGIAASIAKGCYDTKAPLPFYPPRTMYSKEKALKEVEECMKKDCTDEEKDLDKEVCGKFEDIELEITILENACHMKCRSELEVLL